MMMLYDLGGIMKYDYYNHFDTMYYLGGNKTGKVAMKYKPQN